MRRIFTTLGIVAVLSLGAAPTAFAAPEGQVCAELSSGKRDTTGDPLTVTLTAPEGMVITEYCVKAGSAKQGDGPKYYPVNPPAASITIDYPGKAISHYSFTYVKVEAPEEPEAPGNGTPIEETPGNDTPVEETPIEETPGNDTPGNDTPVEETPIEETPGAPGEGPGASEGPAQGPGAPAPAPETPTRALGAPASGAPAQSTGAAATPAQAAQSLQQIADGRAVTNQGLNVQSAGIDASPAQSPVVLGGILALLMTAGFWTLRKSLANQ